GLNVEEMTTVVREAAAHDLPVAAHAQSASSVRNALTAGVTSVEHGYEIDERGIELLLETNAYLVPTLVTATTPPDPTREAGYAVAKKRRLQEHLSENITAAIRAGVKIALGTDSGISDHGQNLRELALLVEHGLSPKRHCWPGHGTPPTCWGRRRGSALWSPANTPTWWCAKVIHSPTSPCSVTLTTSSWSSRVEGPSRTSESRGPAVGDLRKNPVRADVWGHADKASARRPARPVEPESGGVLATLADRLGQVFQYTLGGLPAHALVGDGLAVGQLRRVLEFLVAFLDAALQHHAYDALLPFGDLLTDRGGHTGLTLVVLAAVGVAGVDHQAARQPGVLDHLQGGIDQRCLEVGAAATTTQDHVAVGVALGDHDGSGALGIHPEEGVGGRGRTHRVHRDLDVTVGAVLEPDRCAQTAAELAVHLTFGGAGTDRAPGDHVRDVLRGDRVEEFGARGYTERVDVQQQRACGAQATVDVVGVVERGVVDQTLPPHGRTGLFEVDPHHHAQLVAHRGHQGLEAP